MNLAIILRNPRRLIVATAHGILYEENESSLHRRRELFDFIFAQLYNLGMCAFEHSY